MSGHHLREPLLTDLYHLVPDVSSAANSCRGPAPAGRPSCPTAPHSDLERAAAKRMGATTYELATSHVSMVSRPDLVLDVVRTAAKAVRVPAVTA